MAKTLVEFKDVHTYFYTEAGTVKAVNGVSYKIKEGETVCVVGESGCGKSVTALSLMRLIAAPQGEIVKGNISFDGKDITSLSEEEMMSIRGNDISMIFQEPMTSLNPVFTVGNQIMESIMLHQKLDKKQARDKAIEMIKLVGIPRAEAIVDSYPHELSGGMRQRVALIRTLAIRPKILLLDEAFSALDYQTRLAVSDDVYSIIKKEKKSAIMVTHDIAEAISMADRVIVLTKRPSKVKYVVDIELENKTNPINNRKDKFFSKYYDLIWKEIDYHV